MMWLVTADLHLDDKHQHAYRWGIFDFLAEHNKKARGCLILGDLTDEKDNHSSSLVNRLVAGLEKVRDEGDVYILMGNHDYIDHKTPFFDFLNHMDCVTFVSTPREIDIGIAAIPHQPDQKRFNAACREVFKEMDEIHMTLLHGLFEGAIGDTGHRLSGLSAAVVEKNKPGLVLAGDVHRPQRVGFINYVGAPYRVRFGDDYRPRVLGVCDNSLNDLHYPCPCKHSITISDASEIPELPAGDQIKLTIELKAEEAVDWAKHKALALAVCREMGLEVFGIQLKLPVQRQAKRSPLDQKQDAAATFKGFCAAEGIDTRRAEVGLCLISSQSK